MKILLSIICYYFLKFELILLFIYYYHKYIIINIEKINNRTWSELLNSNAQQKRTQRTIGKYVNVWKKNK